MMKTLTFILTVILLHTCLNVKAQHAYSAKQYQKRLGKIDTLCDVVSAVNIVNDTLTILAMGGKPPYQKFNVAAKGNRVNMDFTRLKGKRVCVIATFMMNKGRPEVVATRAEEFVVDTLPRRNGVQ
ncbi:hypothetical protein EOD41_01255 [Mucilaginibacter limnophilus]|uniref:Uncharacterized protein n=1 Tax=Mucilaginibacter limnophilus TaxID=1932778 RepID=A0A437MY77_9SPHI|nr:hypothetical protein [Mucilaginibacter limnophilus]RVU02597.1 hypothetical protein EOD41_01255 [Mucilaginibacter limnophilus]